MSGPYLVYIDGDGEGATLVDGIDAVVVYANSSADAIAMAKAMFAKSMPAVWATATLIAAASDMEGWKLRARIIALSAAAYSDSTAYAIGDLVTSGGVLYEALQPSTGVPVINGSYWEATGGKTVVDQTVVAGAGKTIDDLGTALATALNSDPSGLVAGAAYDTGTNTLTAAETTDNLGDHELIVEAYPAGAAQDVAIPGVVGTITDQGSAGDALTAVLAADARAVPAVLGKVKRS